MSVLDSFRLEGKVAIVTGASSGLGVAFAQGLAQAGADVAICARRADRLQQTRQVVEAEGRRCVAVEADVSVVEDCARVVEQTVSELGHVDVLVNNAGIGTAVPATREQPDAFRKVIDINLMGSYWMAQACARAMTQGGSIVNIGRRPPTPRARPRSSASRATSRSSGRAARGSASTRWRRGSSHRR
jgi:NAD(P)-dependent dehydrogenase (short-subunit alcohol dehydrogenase family)